MTMHILNRCMATATAAWAMVLTSASWAQSGGGYDLTWSTIDGGGVTQSAGGSYELGGAIGQPDAGQLAGGSYQLNGGFWVFAGAPAGVPCATQVDCVIADTNVCTFDQCSAGFCANTVVEYGNVNGSANQTPNLDDILCVLGGFAGFANCPNADIAPACTGNNIINLDDILAVLGAFGGTDPCGCSP